mgnify:CR=1 FL=1
MTTIIDTLPKARLEAGSPAAAPMVDPFGRAIREGYLELRTDDVQTLTGRPARSVRQMIEENRAMLVEAARGAAAAQPA